MEAAQSSPVFGVRAVHFDLKGVPPTTERLLRLLDVFAAAGYNAVLVEWEDMFPWSVDPRFRCETAYTPDDVRAFAQRAAAVGIEIIPLVQCLGHMETPLSVAEYAPLREVPDRPDVLNPLAPGAQDLVVGMIDDVLNLLPGVRRFHLGGDEAWSFGTHPDTRRFIEEHGAAALYLRHLDPIIAHLHKRNVRPLLWHDMMRDWPEAALRDLGARADLVVWGYRGHPDTATGHYRREVIDRFHAAGVPMWCATAYKGADGPDSDLPNPETRLPNALAWAEIAPRYGFIGAIATAWSRYSTHNLQCEPIGGALDLAAAVGAVLRDGKAPDDAMKAAAALLDRLGESAHFRECRQVLSELCALRAAGWAAVRTARQLAAMTAAEGRRRESQPFRAAVEKLGHLIRKLDGVAERFRRTFERSIPPHWIHRYLAERIEPLREEAALLKARMRQTVPEQMMQ